MSTSKHLTPERLAEIRAEATPQFHPTPKVAELLAHIDAQQVDLAAMTANRDYYAEQLQVVFHKQKDKIDRLQEQNGEQAATFNVMIEGLRERDRLASQVSALRAACLPNHQGHWDKTGGSGSGCPECQRIRSVLADTEAVAKAHDQQIVDAWLAENLPERYQYQVGPDGTLQDAFALLCKDALQTMPGNQQRLRLEGAKQLLRRIEERTDMPVVAYDATLTVSRDVLADMEREVGQ